MLTARVFCDSQVIIGAAYDQKVDLWSLGCVLAELYSGEVLLHNDSLASLLGTFILTLVWAIRMTRVFCLQLDASGYSVLSTRDCSAADVTRRITSPRAGWFTSGTRRARSCG